MSPQRPQGPGHHQGTTGDTALGRLRIPHADKAGKGTDLATLQPNLAEIDHLAISVSKFPSTALPITQAPPQPSPALRYQVLPACNFKESPPESAPPQGWYWLAFFLPSQTLLAFSLLAFSFSVFFFCFVCFVLF